MAAVPKDLVWDAAALPEQAAFAVLEHVAHPLFVKDRAFRFVLLNSALARLVGFPRDAMLGQTDYEFFPRAEIGRSPLMVVRCISRLAPS